MEVLLRGGNVTSDFITKYLGEVNHVNVREKKHPKKQEEHMQKERAPRKAELCIYEMVEEGPSREGEEVTST